MTPSSLKSTDLFNLLCQCEEHVCIACALLFANLSNTYFLSKYHIVVNVWLCSLMFLIIRMLPDCVHRPYLHWGILFLPWLCGKGLGTDEWYEYFDADSASWKWFVSDLFRLWRFWFPLQLLYLPSDKPHWIGWTTPELKLLSLSGQLPKFLLKH